GIAAGGTGLAGGGTFGGGLLAIAVATGVGSHQVSVPIAKTHWAQACAHGNPAACETPCEHNDPVSCINLGDFYKKEMFCVEGTHPGCTNRPLTVGTHILPTNYVRAEAAFERACILESPQVVHSIACTRLVNGSTTLDRGNPYWWEIGDPGVLAGYW